MSHTKEPWEVFEWDDSPSAIHFMSVVSRLTGEMVASYLPIANARRIVACVNACADVEDDCLEQGYVKWLQQRIVELELSVTNLEEKLTKTQAELNEYKYC